MRKINRIINIAIISVLIGVFLGPGPAYAGDALLRVPIAAKDKNFGKRFGELYAETPVQLVRREALALQEKIQPILDRTESVLEGLLEERKLSQPTKEILEKLDRDVIEIARIVRNTTDRLDKESSLETNKNRKILLAAIQNPISDIIINRVAAIQSDAQTSVDVGKLTLKRLGGMKDALQEMKKVLTNLASLSEVRLVKSLDDMYAPGFDYISSGYPYIMTSFDAELQDSRKSPPALPAIIGTGAERTSL